MVSEHQFSWSSTSRAQCGVTRYCWSNYGKARCFDFFSSPTADIVSWHSYCAGSDLSNEVIMFPATGWAYSRLSGSDIYRQEHQAMSSSWHLIDVSSTWELGYFPDLTDIMINTFTYRANIP